MWLDGTPYWHGIQMDETALPILLVDLAFRNGVLDSSGRDALWPMVRRAAAFLACNGPVSPQDRWEEEAGYSPFTIASEIAALLVAADLAEARANHAAAEYLRETADAWNASIERWLYVTGTELAHQHDVHGYYVRVAAPDRADGASPCQGFVPIKNRPPDQSAGPAALMVSLDALAFVRFGLRAADDPRIVSTVKIVDATLKVDTPRGPAWHRYQGDAYGEHPDGRPFDGTGVGRAWPLLTGERAHYELAAGRTEAAGELARAMETLAGETSLLPEQTGTAPTFAPGNCSWGIHPVRQCRLSGHMPNTSSCAGRFETARSSIGLLRPFSGISSRRRHHVILSGASTIRFVRCLRAVASASKRARQLSCIGAWMAGARCRMSQHAIRR